jgi:hypothetical protein
MGGQTGQTGGQTGQSGQTGQMGGQSGQTGGQSGQSGQTGQTGGQSGQSGQTGQTGGQSGQTGGQTGQTGAQPGQLDEQKGWKGGIDCGLEAFGHPRIQSPYDIIFKHFAGNPVMDIDAVRQEVAREVARMEQENENIAAPNEGSNRRGTLPQGFIRHITEVHSPTDTDYLRELEEHMQNVAFYGRREYTSDIPDPIFAAYEELAAQGYFSDPPIPESPVHYSCSLGIIVDTSGSISDAEVAYARESISTILNRQKFSRLVLCSVDADVHFCQEITRVEPEMFRGNGGTDLVEGFYALMEEEVDAILVFTDQETPWPDFDIDIPVIVVSHCPRHPDLPESYRFFQLENPQVKIMSEALNSFSFNTTSTLSVHQPPSTITPASPSPHPWRTPSGFSLV